MSEHTAEIPVEGSPQQDGISDPSETGTSPAAAAPTLGGAMPAPGTITGDLEAMLLSAGRTVPAVKLAVALGLITPEAVEEAQASAVPSPKPSAEGTEASDSPAPVVKSSRKRSKAKSGPAEAEGVIEKAIELLNAQYEKTGRAFRIERIAGGYRFMTLARHAKAVAALHQDRDSIKLSRQAIETLAIIAYRQPITRAELESIRGVACGEVLRSLMERRLIAIVGRSEELGRPMLYGSTKHFLDAFGLASLKDLPSAADLKTAL